MGAAGAARGRGAGAGAALGVLAALAALAAGGPRGAAGAGRGAGPAAAARPGGLALGAAVEGRAPADAAGWARPLLRVAAGGGPDNVAWVNFVDADDTASAFGRLDVQTWGASDDDQMYTAGFLEALTTAPRIEEQFRNLDDWSRKRASGPAYANARQFLTGQYAYANVMCNGKAKGSDFWRATQLVLRQFEGLVDGYAQARKANPELLALDTEDLLLLNAIGDLLDILPAVSNGTAGVPAYDEMSPPELAQAIAQAGHCSGLVRVTPGLEDLLFAHSSWFTYGAMLRIYKHYSFELAEPAWQGSSTSFSSYPGILSSVDDFYLTKETNLAVVQTTNSIFNQTLYDQVTHESVLTWQRMRVANALASSGEAWFEAFRTQNSGTYNNQYMVMNLARFEPGAALLDGLLWVVEQIPGLVVGEDKTATLEMGYWPSFNVPYFREIYERSGYPEFKRRHAARGPEYARAVSGIDYQTAPRAKIFRRDAGNVHDIDSLKYIMRSNGWPEDPYSGGSPMGAICSRGDLDPKSPVAGGCYDTKGTNFEMAKEMRSEAVNGPTAQGQPVFRWTNEFASVSHVGQPSDFDFKFEEQKPAQRPPDSPSGQTAAE